jgi:hypothetical protein
MSVSLSTVAVAVLISGSISPTVSNIPKLLAKPVLPVQNVTSFIPNHGTGFLGLATLSANDNLYEHETLIRPTTVPEQVMGEIRSLGLLKANWDGEGAFTPSTKSIEEAVSFIRLMSDEALLPEPTLQVSGNVSLFWNEHGLYADIEFLGDNRVAYFIKTNEDKHKGVISFDSKQMPAVFPAIFLV